MDLYFARHGETGGNRAFKEGRTQENQTDEERRDPELTQTGVEQAGLLGERLSARKIDYILSSTLLRAINTAYEVSIRQENPIKIELFPDLVETGTEVGYISRPMDGLKERFPLIVPYEGGKSAMGGSALEKIEDDFEEQKRAKRCVNYILNRFKGDETVLIVSHAGIMTHLIREIMGIEDFDKYELSNVNTGLTKVKIEEDGRVNLRYLNNAAHLYTLDRDMAYGLNY